MTRKRPDISVLYVDDEELLLETIKISLERSSGFSVDTALSAPDALDKIRKKSFDIIISDYQMPVMNGIQFLKHLRDSGDETPFIIFTGRGREEIVIEAYNAGADSYIVKGGDPKILFLDLVRAIEQIVSNRKMDQELRFKNTLLAIQQEVTLDGILVLDTSGGVISYNPRFSSMWGMTGEDRIPGSGDELFRMLAGRLSDPGPLLKKVTHFHEHPKETCRGEISLADGRTLDSYSAPLEGPQMQVFGRIWYFRDVTEQRRARDELEEKVLERTAQLNKSLHEKEILLKEIHHRVKNNLQIIASLTSIQARHIHDESVLNALKESQNRIRAMALVHERLYRSDDISHIDLTDYVRFLITSLFKFYNVSSSQIRFTVELKDVPVDIHSAIPIGLMVNELVSNSLKHAFTEKGRGEISISGKKNGHRIDLIVRDTGKGIPGTFDWRNAESLGLRLVIMLVDQMNGTIDLDPGPGTTFRILLEEKT